MSASSFDLDAYLERIGLLRPSAPNLDTLRSVVAAHIAAIPFENIDVLLGRPPKLDPQSLQNKLIRHKRGGYCYEQNILLRSALRELGFNAVGLFARVVRGFPADAPRAATHMLIRVDMADGPFLVDAGLGSLTPTGPISLEPFAEQQTPHEPMRLLPVGSELVLQVKLGDNWQNLCRLCSHTALDEDYAIANWFSATHPSSPFVTNMMAARAERDGTRQTFQNGVVTHRYSDGRVDRREINDCDMVEVLRDVFGIELQEEEVLTALNVIVRSGRCGSAYWKIG